MWVRLPDFLALVNVGALPILGTKPRLADASVGPGAVLSGGWMRSIQDHTLYFGSVARIVQTDLAFRIDSADAVVAALVHVFAHVGVCL